MTNLPESPLPPPPARRIRRDGWNEARIAAFVDALRAGGSIAGAAASVGMSRNSAYRLRASPDGAVAGEAWGNRASFSFEEFFDIIEASVERKYAAADAADTEKNSLWLIRDLGTRTRLARRRAWAAARRYKAAKNPVVS